jgi:hypothetical protein
MTFFSWVRKMVAGFLNWIKLMFADDDAHHVQGAPVMRNVVLFMLTVVFMIGFLKVVYLMDVVVHHDIKAVNNMTMQFKSLDTTMATQPANIQDLKSRLAALEAAAQTEQQSTQTFSIPDIPSGWQLVLLGGMGAYGAVSMVKKVSEYKYLGSGGSSRQGGAEPGDKDKGDGK